MYLYQSMNKCQQLFMNVIVFVRSHSFYDNLMQVLCIGIMGLIKVEYKS